MYEYDVTVPFNWKRDETEGCEVDGWLERASVALFNGLGAKVLDFTGVPAPDLDPDLDLGSDDEFTLEMLADVAEAIEVGNTRFLQTTWTGGFTIAKTVLATSQRQAINTVAELVENALYQDDHDDTALVDWCRAPEVWQAG